LQLITNVNRLQDSQITDVWFLSAILVIHYIITRDRLLVELQPNIWV
jgi:hypothetical protein